jgi:shikimate kinase
LTTTDDDAIATPQDGHRVVLLVGFMGAGKTSVGRALAKRLHRRFLDLDEVVVAREGRSVADVFSQSGEEGFRARESAALQDLLRELEATSDRAVVALGGGSLTQQANRDAISASGFPVIFLDASPAELFRRCRAQDLARPLLNDLRTFEDLYRSRHAQYASLGTRLDTTATSADEVCSQIQRSLRFAEEIN